MRRAAAWLVAVAVVVLGQSLFSFARDAYYDRALAMVNGHIITLSETREAAWGMSGAVEPDSLQLAGALDALIDQRLLIQAAESQGISPPPESIDRAVHSMMTDLRGNFKDEAAFDAFLRRNGMTVESLRSLIRERENRQKIIREALSRRIRITDDDVKQLEQRLRSEGRETEYFLIDHILFRYKARRTPETDAATYQRAADAAARLQQGEDFERLARELSEDVSTARQGGALGWVAAGHLQPELRQAAVAMTPGATSQPVKSGTGCHILRLRGKRDPRSMLYEQRTAEERKRWVADLRQKADIRYFPLNSPADSPSSGSLNRK